VFCPPPCPRHSLHRETTADVNGIEAFPVDVEDNCGWGETLIVIVGLPVLSPTFI
jgi:hypothetical protein